LILDRIESSLTMT